MDRNERIKAFREGVAKENEGHFGAHRRYTTELRRLAVIHCYEGRLEGRTFVELARELGIDTSNLKGWFAKSPEADRFPKGVLRPVEIVEPAVERASHQSSIPQTQGLSVTTPKGFRIEGLSWSQALEIMELGA